MSAATLHLPFGEIVKVKRWKTEWKWNFWLTRENVTFFTSQPVFLRVWSSQPDFTGFWVLTPILHVFCVLTRKIGWFYELKRIFNNHGFEIKPNRFQLALQVKRSFPYVHIIVSIVAVWSHQYSIHENIAFDAGVSVLRENLMKSLDGMQNTGASSIGRPFTSGFRDR